MTYHSKLVIHPRDETTDFLSPIYERLRNVTLVRGGVDRDELRSMIDQHDQIMMMGHGTPLGLISNRQFNGIYGHIIDNSFAEQLATKKDSVFIWCDANKYVDRHLLSGFYTGMFISEMAEAYYCGVRDATPAHVKESNEGFAKLMSDAMQAGEYAEVRSKYADMAVWNPVARYNYERLYYWNEYYWNNKAAAMF